MYKKKSSFCGRLNEICGIALDNFEKDCLKSRAFFLSHCHVDHTQGLFSDELLDLIVSNNVNIYTSEITKNIVLSEKSITSKHKEVFQKYITVLALGSTYITLPELFGFKEEYLNVITLPAGHCIGSVMFLFKTNDKTVLYTGDFRLSTRDVKEIRALHNSNGEPIKVDALYLDTTFIDKRFPVWPKRTHCVNEVSDIVVNWLAQDVNNRVAFSTGAKYGYEYLFEKISEKLGLKVFVGDNRLKIYRKHSRLRDVFTDELSLTKLHICSNRREDDSHFQCGIKPDDCEVHYLFIRVSAWIWNNFDLEMSSVRKDKYSKNKINVCFPTHCSRNELLYFINYLSPLKIVGFPNKYSEKESPSVTPVKSSYVKAKRQYSSSLPEIEDSEKRVDGNVIKRLFEPIF